MHFGSTLRESTYPPWKDKYIDYQKLKTVLKDDKKLGERDWTNEDDRRFSDELLNVQLNNVVAFKEERYNDLKERVESAMKRLEDVGPTDDGPGGDEVTARLKELREELDSISNEMKELQKYSSINYTAFIKIVKKHDRKRGQHYKMRAMIQLSLSERGLNSQGVYTALVRRLSDMYWAINSRLEEGEQLQPPDLEQDGELLNGGRYTAHKFWVHPDNLLEVKTYILRRLPALVFSEQSAKEVDGNDDPSITSLYFDSPKFDLYTNKAEHQVDASSVRLRWYGQLSARPGILLEQKIIHKNGTSEEKKFAIKDKYVKAFMDGEYKMEKTVQKMERQGQQPEQVEAFKRTVDEIQGFIRGNKLEPVLRANYSRTAFQKPADDRVRISIDSDIAFIREDTLDQDRPCRDPSQWHRTDIDNSNMSYPFPYINQSEVSRFPYAVLEIKLKDYGNNRKPSWVEDLTGSHLVHAAPRFSKFVHGVASLFEDHVNNLPFWLSDLTKDIRKDPQDAFKEEERRRAERARDEQAVGSFLGKQTSSYKPAASSPVGQSYLSERAAADAIAERDADAQHDEAHTEEAGEEDEEAEASTDDRRNYGTLSSVFPSFSMSRYTRLNRERVQLPEGVVEPKTWLKNAGPLQIEPKVWLANERTFLKWQHICVLLGSLAVGLYSAAGGNFLAECMGVAYIVIAMMTGVWGYFILQKRRNMIIERSGKDFDNLLGPLAVSAALMAALILNFIFAYRDAFERLNKDVGHVNGTGGDVVGEL